MWCTILLHQVGPRFSALGLPAAMTQIQQGPGNTLRGCCRFVMPNSSSTTALSEHGHGAWHTLLVAAIYGWSDVIHKGVEMGLSKTQV